MPGRGAVVLNDEADHSASPPLLPNIRHPHSIKRATMTAPMTTEIRARLDPLGPDPKAMGNGPMKTTPPTEAPVCVAEPTIISPKPIRKMSRPASKSFCNCYTRLSTTVKTIRMIASTIATLAHFMSDPKMIGTGPIMTTPPPFNWLPLLLA